MAHEEVVRRLLIHMPSVRSVHASRDVASHGVRRHACVMPYDWFRVARSFGLLVARGGPCFPARAAVILGLGESL